MDIQIISWILGITFIAYLIGSIPTGFILVKLIKGEDIREVGSGSTGATNVKRVLGKKGFFSVMILDILKGALPVLLAKWLEVKYNLYSEISILPVLVSVAIIVGHSKSIYLGFTGGKSMASGAGTILGLNWSVAIATGIIWSLLSYFSKYVSLGSIIAISLTPVWMYLFKAPLPYTIYAAVGALYIVYLHKENIVRLVKGTENKVRK